MTRQEIAVQLKRLADEAYFNQDLMLARILFAVATIIVTQHIDQLDNLLSNLKRFVYSNRG
jgi:hypothetical protein